MPLTGAQKKMNAAGYNVGKSGDRAVITFCFTCAAGITDTAQGSYLATRAGRIEDVTLHAAAIDSADTKLGLKIGSTVVVTLVTVTAGTPLQATVITASSANIFAKGDAIEAVVTTKASTGAITNGTCVVGVVYETEEYLTS
jgi:hypothetical protein